MLMLKTNLEIKVVFLPIIIVLGVFLMDSSAFADIRWGLDGGVVTGYDDNVTYVNSNKISDMITRTSLDAGITQESSTDTFDLKTGVTENIYTNHSSLDNLAENLNANYKVDVNPFEHIKALDTFTHSVDPGSLAIAFGRINGNYETYYNNLDLESQTDITEQWSGTFKYVQTNYNYTIPSLSDTALYNPELSTKYDFSSQSQGMLNYDYRRRTFSPGKSADAHTPSAGWRQYLDPTWYVDLLAGADFIKGFGQSLIEPRYAAGLTHDVGQNTRLSLTYNKQYETDQYTQDINNDWYATLNGYHEFTSRLSGDISFFTGQGRYVTSRISDKYIGTNVAFKYAVTDHIDVTLMYTFQDSISNSSIRANTQNTVFAGLTYKY